jgi:hypothetical protein
MTPKVGRFWEGTPATEVLPCGKQPLIQGGVDGVSLPKLVAAWSLPSGSLSDGCVVATLDQSRQEVIMRAGKGTE